MSDKHPDAGSGPGRHAGLEVGPITNSAEERLLVEALLRGDEQVFSDLVQEHHTSLLRVAQLYVRGRAVAEDVVQDAWVGVLEGLQRFEGRSSLKTWIFRILINNAKKRAMREQRSIPFSALDRFESSGFEPSVEPDRFLDVHGPWIGHWSSPPQSWEEIPEDRLLSQESRALVERAIESLPPQQRTVITLRDVDGWSAAEVCNVLELTETNQRVLLHRARSKIRSDLERYVRDTESRHG